MKIDYTRFNWLDRSVIEVVADALRDDPEMGRPSLSKRTGLSMYKCEKVLDIFRDYDLYQYLDAENPVDEILEALELGYEDDEPELEDEFDDVGEAVFEHDANYIYDEETDEYLVMLKVGNDVRQFKIPGRMHREMLEAYSDWNGDKQTLNRIAKNFGVSRKWFHAYKTTMGWTHDSDPFTDEQILEGDPDELARRALQKKRLVVEERYRNYEAEQDRKDAEKFRRIEKLVLEPLAESLKGHMPSLDVPLLDLEPPNEPFAAVVSPADLHYGKVGYEGFVKNPYDRAEAEDRLVAHTQALLADITRFGQPEEIIAGIAGDWFHIDSAYATTSKGTQLKIDGHVWQVIDGGVELALKFIGLLLQAAPKVRVVLAKGNHDNYSTLMLMKLLEVTFRGDERVEIIVEPRTRIYIEYGASILGFTHGDHWKRTQTPRKILSEPPREMLKRTIHRVWFTGHLHHEKFTDLNGVTWYQLPSLAGDDEYHDDEGYNESRKALAGHIIRRESGVVCNMLSPVGQS